MFLHGGNKEHLWPLIGPPLVWALHFLACYCVAAVVCAKLPADQGAFIALRLSILALTVLALAAIALSAWRAWAEWGFGERDPPHEKPTLEDRRGFLGFATLLLAGLSAVAVLFGAMPAVLIGACTR